jgi:hypothetical protein
MRVRCKTNRGEDLEAPYFHPQIGKPVGQRFHLTPGESYVVYAMGFHGPGTWFYVADDHFSDAPHQYASTLFELEDPAVSGHWVLTMNHNDAEQPDMLAPVEWGREPWFYERLFDGEPKAVAIFARQKALLDREDEARRKREDEREPKNDDEHEPVSDDEHENENENAEE